ncbi:MAG TPA: hypothetical protein VFN57_02700 [Thermomicrobiaceae bacterium]|nr:hypothetical protein [Thermomicrobiaceae bacterium]
MAGAEHQEHGEHETPHGAEQPAEVKPKRRAPRRSAGPAETAPQGSMVNPSHETAGPADGATESQAVQRAEELVDRMGGAISHFVDQVRGEATGRSGTTAEEGAEQAGERVGRFVSRIGVESMRAVARAREELEDIWAEAQHVRQGNRQE